MLEVQHVIDEWLIKYNTVRPHRSLARKTPAAYAKMLIDRCMYDEGGGSE